jgi:hypothetical protein
MKLLKYLNLNFEPYSCGCDHSLCLREDRVDLKFEYLPIKREKSLSYLETIIIGCKSYNLTEKLNSNKTLYMYLISFHRYSN